MFDRIESRSAAELTADRISEDISSGFYASGDTIPSVRFLMKRYGRSYGAVRDALDILVQKGCLEYANRKSGSAYTIAGVPGPSVHMGDLEYILDLRSVRISDIVEYLTAAEPEIACLAAGRRTWEDILMLERQAEKTAECGSDGHAYYASVMDFHRRVARAAHNPPAALIWDAAISILRAGAPAVTYDGSPLHALMRELIDAIKSRDAFAAREAEVECWKAYETAFRGLLRYGNRSGVTDSAAASGRSVNRSSDIIYRQIRDRILDGSVREGEQLPSERTLASEFGRSRPVVREALARLAVEKYITVNQKSGMIVNSVPEDEIKGVLDNFQKYDLVSREAIMEMRDVSDVIAAVLASGRRTYRDIYELESILSESESCITDRRAFMECGEKFNDCVVRAAHNGMAFIVERMTAVFMQDRFDIEITDEIMRQHEEVLGQHRAIADAIIAQDDDSARETTLSHLKTLLPYMH